MFWLDTTGGAPYTLKVRDAGNNHWLTVLRVTDPGSDGDVTFPTIPETSGGTGQTTFTAGDILYSDGSNSLAKLPKGSASQVLQMNSGATAPEWASGGGATEYLSGTASTSNPSELALENVMTSSDYLYYKIEAYLYPETNEVNINGYLGKGGGSTSWHTSGYYTAGFRAYKGSSTGTASNSSTTVASQATDVGSASSDGGLQFSGIIFKPYDTARIKQWFYNWTKYEANDHMNAGFGGSAQTDVAAITAVKFSAASDGINGEIRLYGVKGS